MSGTEGVPEPLREQELQAAEYVMGALPPHQARAIEALAMSDVGLAASIAAWEARLAPLAALTPPVEPPPELWRRLALATGLGAPAPGPAPMQVVPFLRRVSVWRSMTAGAMAIAAGLALFLLVRPAPAPLIAALSPFGQPGATFLVRVAEDGTATVLAVGAASVPAGKSLELWAVAAGATTPVSMGLLPESGRAVLSVPRPAGTQLLVSQEQAGGSPTGKPMGPVVYAGTLTGI